MPKRSSASPKTSSRPRETVLAELFGWAAAARAADPNVLRVGVFGSYARGDHTPASDVDLLVVVRRSADRPWERPLALPAPPRRLPCELFVYTAEEMEQARRAGSAWMREVLSTVLWLDEEPG